MGTARGLPPRTSTTTPPERQVIGAGRRGRSRRTCIRRDHGCGRRWKNPEPTGATAPATTASCEKPQPAGGVQPAWLGGSQIGWNRIMTTAAPGWMIRAAKGLAVGHLLRR